MFFQIHLISNKKKFVVLFYNYIFLKKKKSNLI